MDARLRFVAFPLSGHDLCLSAIVHRDAMPYWGRGLALSVLDCWVPECPPYGAPRDFQPKQEFRPMNKSLSDLRIDAFVRQAGLCYYCTVLIAGVRTPRFKRRNFSRIFGAPQLGCSCFKCTMRVSICSGSLFACR